MTQTSYSPSAAADGVPVMAPVLELSDRPAGRLPDSMAQVIGVVPVAARVRPVLAVPTSMSPKLTVLIAGAEVAPAVPAGFSLLRKATLTPGASDRSAAPP